LENGNINDLSLRTIVAFFTAFLIDEAEIKEHFDKKYDYIINYLTFDKNEFDEKQLRFHQITRTPLIKINKFYIVSPELLLDSLFTNIHYSLLESTEIKNNYKKIQSNQFINKIVEVSNPFGFTEVLRELELFEGNKQIGDIDLIIKDKVGNYILIEAKNHALPLDVYFKDVIKTKDHLDELQKNWEKKVLKRIDYLKKKHLEYSIPSSYQYIVVSKFPEIISHYSNILILSLKEFEYWLLKERWTQDFEEIIDNFYKIHQIDFSIQNIESLSDLGFFFGRFDDD
jgi:hypothetical protein